MGGKDKSIWLLEIMSPLHFLPTFQIRETPPQPKAGPHTDPPFSCLYPLTLLS